MKWQKKEDGWKEEKKTRKNWIVRREKLWAKMKTIDVEYGIPFNCEAIRA